MEWLRREDGFALAAGNLLASELILLHFELICVGPNHVCGISIGVVLRM